MRPAGGYKFNNNNIADVTKAGVSLINLGDVTYNGNFELYCDLKVIELTMDI